MVDNTQDCILTFSSMTDWAIFLLSWCPCEALSFFSAFVFILIANQATAQLPFHLVIESGNLTKAQSQKSNQRGFELQFKFCFICVKLFIDPHVLSFS